MLLLLGNPVLDDRFASAHDRAKAKEGDWSSAEHHVLRKPPASIPTA
jgi:hypothetical protein